MPMNWTMAAPYLMGHRNRGALCPNMLVQARGLALSAGHFPTAISTGIIALVFSAPRHHNESNSHYDQGHHHGGAHKDDGVHAQTISPAIVAAATKAICRSIWVMFTSSPLTTVKTAGRPAWKHAKIFDVGGLPA